MTLRKLSAREISSLQNQGCICEEWNLVEVGSSFNPLALWNVSLSGKIRLGEFQKDIRLPGEITVPSGISNCCIHNCKIGDNVYINNVKMLSNYEIGNDVIMENLDSVIVEGVTSFGNGTQLDIVNEAGGRSLKIFDKLSANIAYLLVFYRHKEQFIKKLEEMVDEYIISKKSSTGAIQSGAILLNCGPITNVQIGPGAVITGIAELKEGTIASCQEDPAKVGTGVIARNFIILSGAKVDDASLISSSFIGQGVKIGKQYSTENSAFFANSEVFHGEACSIFAGPYTASHHKSTLLIAGYFSFFNAGSSSNQSNHMYKLGPIHQGIIERGSKTGSSSYLLWPSRVGAFTTVLGKHYVNFDSSELPFSYISEEDGKSFITPAMNMFTAGTRRDSQKWQARDRRKDPEKLDLINFDIFSPYCVSKMVRAVNILNELYSNTPKDKEVINYKGINIKRLMLKASRKYYEMGIKIFIGNSIVKHLENLPIKTTWSQIKFALSADPDTKLTRWADIAGLLVPEETIKKLTEDIELGNVKTIEEMHIALCKIFKRYIINEWNWCAKLLEEQYNIKVKDITPELLKSIITEWKNNRIKLNNMIMQDAEKEFDSFAKIGFGIDGDCSVIDSDFEVVRGKPEENSFIISLKKESQEIEETAENIIMHLEEVGK